MTTSSAGVLPSYQRFANGVPVPLFTRRSFRPREKYLILLVFLTFGVVCFGAFFFLPDFRTGSAAVNSVYRRVYQRMQQAGPELLLPVPPHASGDVKDSHAHVPNAIPPGHEDRDHQDVHLVEDKQKLQVLREFRARLRARARARSILSKAHLARRRQLSVTYGARFAFFLFLSFSRSS